MSFPVGIGIVTYNRRAILSDTIDQVRAFTRQPNAALVVADDGSSDGTWGMLRDKQVPAITGVEQEPRLVSAVAYAAVRNGDSARRRYEAEQIWLGSGLDTGGTAMGSCQLCGRLDEGVFPIGDRDGR